MYIQPATVAVEQHFIQAFSWMLLHSLWQGLLLAITGGLLLSFCRRSSAAVRYNLAFIHFLLFVAGCICTFAWEWEKVPLQINLHPLVGLVKARGVLPFRHNVAGLRHFANLCLATFSANAPLVVLLWFGFFLFRSVRLMGGLLYVYRAKRRYVFQPAQEWINKVEALCKKLNLKKRVQLLESGYVKMPLVIGNLKPVIFIPIGLMAGLPAGQVEAILLHELAHIRRNDYLTNLFQVITETLFFFNPGLLWISAILRDERENCCDDIALEQTKNKKEFVQALVSFKEYALYGNNYQVAFPGKKNHLLNRVRRIIGQNSKGPGTAERASFMAGVIVLLLIVATAAVTHAGTIRNSIVHNRLISVYTTRKTATKITSFNKSARPRHIMAYKPNPMPVVSLVMMKEREQLSEVQMTDSDGRSARVEKIQYIKQKSQAIDEQAVEISREQVATTQNNLQLKAAQEQNARDQAGAKVAQAQALKDQAQAKRDQEGAARDQAQAKLDQEQSKREQDQALTDQQQAKRDQEQAQRNVEQAQKNDEQVKKNAEQAIRNQQQQQRNDLQVVRNREQTERNHEQAIRNQIQANRNMQQDSINRKLSKGNVSVQ